MVMIARRLTDTSPRPLLSVDFCDTIDSIDTAASWIFSSSSNCLRMTATILRSIDGFTTVRV
jgi:hypothetical protein